MEYQDFLASKAIRAKARGISKIPELAPHLFDFQRMCVEHHLRVGAAACFLSTGCGKTEVQLEWCQKAIEETNGRALLLTPLAVAGQTKRRADRWGYEARVIREQSEVGPGINICNYDRIDKLDPDEFAVASLDEASLMKSWTGKTTRKLIDVFRGHRFKLVATATPAPNDHMELGNYAEFLEVMAANEMLSRFFINDTSTASHEWRLKGHAVQAFWDWVASWARMGDKPSDITGNLADDAPYTLPPFEVIKHRAADSRIDRDLQDLFGAPAISATNLHDIKRQTIEARAEKLASVVSAEKDETWIIWCHTDYEADVICRMLPHAIEVRGSQSADEKEEKLEAFSTGRACILVSKPQLAGFGLDWAHCAHMAFVGQSFSYETWYQAVRRCWRFGQQRNLKVHLIVAEGEAEIGRVIDRKSGDHEKMKVAMRSAMRRATGSDVTNKVAYKPTHIGELPSWICAA
ncbi:MAG TPA: helicase-related protein [Bryobacteraceae bacterium]|nr:helicase-related protein [Bryobacteraceae bacterium]